MKKLCSMLLILTLLLAACAPAVPLGDDLTRGIAANPVNVKNVSLTGEGSAAAMDFAVGLLRRAEGGKNTLLSPVSVLYALGMTVNGAQGETRAQMEAVLGMNAKELNAYLHAYLNSLPQAEKYRLSMANSIWLRDADSLSVERDFLQANADYYGAGVYKAPFDTTTLDQINNWVKENTNGMIERIIEEIPPQAMLYLINALSFEAEWQTIYEDIQLSEGVFTTEAGEARQAELMHGMERHYIEDGLATGFLKYYADEKYAFAALLPNEGVSMADYIASLTGEGLHATLAGAKDAVVDAVIPKFECEYSAELGGMLAAMGMTDAFDTELADFSAMGKSANGNLSIGSVLHKTRIAVDERGTTAGAVTAVMMEVGGAMLEEIKQVYLDRPFLYMLIDCETNLPLFIGTMLDIKE